MTIRELKRALHDKTISDNEFIKILQRYFETKDTKDKKLKKGIYSTNSAEYIRAAAALIRFGKLIKKLRPTIKEITR